MTDRMNAVTPHRGFHPQGFRKPSSSYVFWVPFGDKGDHFTAFLNTPDLGKAINQIHSSLTFYFLHLLLKFCALCVSQILFKWFSNKDPLEPHLLSLSSFFFFTSFVLPTTNLPLSVQRKRVWNKATQIWTSWRRWSIYKQCIPCGVHQNFSSERNW